MSRHRRHHSSHQPAQARPSASQQPAAAQPQGNGAAQEQLPAAPEQASPLLEGEAEGQTGATGPEQGDAVGGGGGQGQQPPQGGPSAGDPPPGGGPAALNTIPNALDPALEARLGILQVAQRADGWTVTLPTAYLRPFGGGQALLAATVAVARRHLAGATPSAAVSTAVRDGSAVGQVRVLEPSFELATFDGDTFTIDIGWPALNHVREALHLRWRDDPQTVADRDEININAWYEQAMAHAYGRWPEIAALLDPADLQRRNLSPAQVSESISSRAARLALAPVLDALPEARPIRALMAEATITEPTQQVDPAVFARIPARAWATSLVRLAAMMRDAVVERDQRNQQEFERRMGAAVHRPRQVPLGSDPIRGTLERYNPNGSVTMNLGGPVRVTGGQRVRNAVGHSLFIIDANAGGVLFQNEADHLFYTQTTQGFESELQAGALAEGARRAAPAVALVEFEMHALSALFFPVRATFLAAHVLQAAVTLHSNWNQISRAWTSVRATRTWLDQRYPGLVSAMLRGMITNRELVDWDGQVAFGEWIVTALRIAATAVSVARPTALASAGILNASSTAMRVLSILGASFQVAIAGFRSVRIDVDRVQAEATLRRQLQEALQGQNVADAQRWVDEIMRHPEDLERLQQEVQLTSAAFQDFSRALEPLAH